MNKKSRRCHHGRRPCLPLRCKPNGASKHPCSINRCRPKPLKRSVFSEQVFPDVPTSDNFVALPAQDTSNKSVYSYAVVNKGSEPAVAQLEIGPNGKDYSIDVAEIVPNGGTTIVVPTRFQRFTRLLVKSQNEGKPTGVTVYFQAQQIV